MKNWIYRLFEEKDNKLAFLVTDCMLNHRSCLVLHGALAIIEDKENISWVFGSFSDRGEGYIYFTGYFIGWIIISNFDRPVNKYRVITFPPDCQDLAEPMGGENHVSPT